MSKFEKEISSAVEKTKELAAERNLSDIGKRIVLAGLIVGGIVPPDAPTNPEPEVKFVHGLKGIQMLFNCSHLTAQRYKDTILRDAIQQDGRKITVDVRKARELFLKAKSKRI